MKVRRGFSLSSRVVACTLARLPTMSQPRSTATPASSMPRRALLVSNAGFSSGLSARRVSPKTPARAI